MLRAKKSLGLSSPQAKAPGDRAPPSTRQTATCINCGYDLGGQIVDRCPECGLRLALQYRDPTPWGSHGPTIQAWLETAGAVLRLDRRTRVRTSLVPTTRETRRFAIRSILVTAPLAGCAVALMYAHAGQTHTIAAAMFIARLLVTAILAAGFLAAVMYGGAAAVTGRWHRFRFVPASLHYSTAWWPPTAVAAFALTGLYRWVPCAETSALVAIAALAGTLAWGGWLAASVSESGRVSRPTPRVLTLTAVVAACGVLLPAMPAWLVRLSVSRVLAARDSGLALVQSCGILGAAPASPRPRTCAIIIDAIPSGDEELIADRIAKLGAGAPDRVRLRDKECTLANIKKALEVARNELGAADGLILYINGHGSQYGSGSIRMVDGEITSQVLADFLEGLRAKRRLVIIDSCFGGNFIRSLRGSGAVVLAATDDDNVAFTSGLQPFWTALANAAYDTNRDGRITIREAFWGAYRKMLAAAEKNREAMLARAADDPRKVRLLNWHGYATPQLETFGTAAADDFFTEAPAEESEPTQRRSFAPPTTAPARRAGNS